MGANLVCFLSSGSPEPGPGLGPQQGFVCMCKVTRTSSWPTRAHEASHGLLAPWEELLPSGTDRWCGAQSRGAAFISELL